MRSSFYNLQWLETDPFESVFNAAKRTVKVFYSHLTKHLAVRRY